MTRGQERFTDVVLTCCALVLAAHSAFSAHMLGDYPTDAGPAINALLSGSLVAFAHTHPAMGDLSLLVRLPFAAIAQTAHDSQLGIYRWGVLPCVTSVALLGLWLARTARSHGTGPLGQFLIMALALLNPLVSSAIDLGHPEELMTASLCVGALVAACEQRPILSAVLLGLALACKQWSIVAVLPVLLVLERSRLRALGGALVLALLMTVPQVIGAPKAWFEAQLVLAHRRDHMVSALSWWWSVAPAKTVGLESGHLAVVTRRLPSPLVGWLHALIIGVGVAAATVLAWVRGLPLRPPDGLALMAAVLLLRCTLDAETMPYYHVALLLTLLAWDAIEGAALPFRGLVAVALAYILFDRLTPPVVGSPAASLLYGAVTFSGLLAIAWSLRRSSWSDSGPAETLFGGRDRAHSRHLVGGVTTLADPSALPKTSGSAFGG